MKQIDAFLPKEIPTMKKIKDRRKNKRWKVAVLVRCSLPQVSKDILEMEMWARDVNEKGMKLEWTRGLGVSRLSGPEKVTKEPLRYEDIKFLKGANVLVQDLFYDDDGTPFMEGKIIWARQSSTSGHWALGLTFVKSEKHTKEVLGAFSDFLKIVKNPTFALEKASKKSL